MRAGANAYVSKDAEPRHFLDAIRIAAAGGQYVQPKEAARVLMQLATRSNPAPHETLTPRETQIMRLPQR